MSESSADGFYMKKSARTYVCRAFFMQGVIFTARVTENHESYENARLVDNSAGKRS
jgi:hypothetical protein